MSTDTGTWDKGVYDTSKIVTAFVDSNHATLAVLSADNNEVVFRAAGTQHGAASVYEMLYDTLTGTGGGTYFGPISSCVLVSPDGTNTTIQHKMSGGRLILVDTNRKTVEYVMPLNGTGQQNSSVLPLASGGHASGPHYRMLRSHGYI